MNRWILVLVMSAFLSPGLSSFCFAQQGSSREERREELETVFQGWFDAHTRLEIFEAGQREGLPCGPVLTTGEVMSDEHFRTRDYFTDIVHPDAGTLTYTGLPFGLSDAPREDARPAPRLGQHNEDVFARILGMDEGDMSRLREEGVI